jgi:Tfp pilus assembly protein PilZ
MMAGNLALLFVIGYVIQRDFRAPYFQALPRSWRESKRIPIKHVIRVNDQERRISDLSQGGCFIAEPGLGLLAGNRVPLAFESDTLRIKCLGEIRRVSPEGYGVQFLGLPAGKRRDIRLMLKKRFSLRYEVNLDCTWSFDSKKRDATILNISKGGCYLSTSMSGIEPGIYGNIAFVLKSRSYHFIARVVWINETVKHEKPVGFGVQFTHRHTRTVKAILRSYGKRVLTR